MSFITSLLTALIAVFVILNSEKIKPRSGRYALQAIAALIGAIAFLLSLSKMLVIIPTGKVGVADFEGQVAPNTLTPGFHVMNPFSDVVTFSTRLTDIKETIEATSQEGLAFNMDVSIQYRLDPQQAARVYQQIGTDEREIVISRFRSIVRETTAMYPADAIYSSKRQDVAARMQQRLTQQIVPLGYVIEAVLLREVQIPNTLQAAIQEKLKAEQASQQMTFVLEREKQEAERKRIEARGQADAQKILSQGLTPSVLQLRSIEATEKLAQSSNAKVIVVGGSSHGAPLMLQLDGNAASSQ
jgi:regulator of protease activity HflC (stomatin/prohibitin superfamily)